MRKHHIRHLVVVDERGRLVGMLALRYLFGMRGGVLVGDATGAPSAREAAICGGPGATNSETRMPHSRSAAQHS